MSAPPSSLPEEPEEDFEIDEADFDFGDFDREDVPDAQPQVIVMNTSDVAKKKESPMTTAPQPVANTSSVTPRMPSRPSAASVWLSAQVARFRAFRAESSTLARRFVLGVISIVATCMVLSVVTWGIKALLSRQDVQVSLSYDYIPPVVSIVGLVVIALILKGSVEWPASWSFMAQIGLSMLILHMIIPDLSPLVFLSIFPLFNVYVLLTILLTAAYSLLAIRPQMFAS